MGFVRFALAAAVISLTGCTVYAPMQGAAPLIRGRNQAELTASTYFNSRWEASAAYSPLRYVLLRGAVGRGRSGGSANDTVYFRSRQYEAAAGGYWPINQTFVAGGLLGYGRAHTARGFSNRGLPFAYHRLYRYEAAYHRTFAELYAFADSEWARAGFAYRLNRVQFDAFASGGRPLPLSRTLRHELMSFVGLHGPAGTRWRGVGLQLAMGLSVVPTSQAAASGQGYDEYLPRRNQLYSTLTLQLFPHYWVTHPQAIRE
ncbi:hypothetical protein LJ737_12620 [Hymenobacter sp. 15J16-1T3B]|uniref:hypothetical protein n=1 Tax=Hymenobacter sp. 15J16-1T3B TaxID=2886941 RepID=UPI001D100BA7|nr:hypothetical protein [Hymenobacter sp. 15J16-1T3B]MCC3158085.1 hypothetical protein [Hymenobacter sp. 15J16-1T3B]